MPFWWETPKGDKILVWNGEHYHFGNELGIVPKANSSYIIKDECDAKTIYTDHWKVMTTRIPRIFEKLEKEGYQYDFYLNLVHGSCDGKPLVDGNTGKAGQYGIQFRRGCAVAVNTAIVLFEGNADGQAQRIILGKGSSQIAG